MTSCVHKQSSIIVTRSKHQIFVQKKIKFGSIEYIQMHTTKYILHKTNNSNLLRQLIQLFDKTDFILVINFIVYYLLFIIIRLI